MEQQFLEKEVQRQKIQIQTREHLMIMCLDIVLPQGTPGSQKYQPLRTMYKKKYQTHQIEVIPYAQIKAANPSQKLTNNQHQNTNTLPNQNKNIGPNINGANPLINQSNDDNKQNKSKNKKFDIQLFDSNLNILVGIWTQAVLNKGSYHHKGELNTISMQSLNKNIMQLALDIVLSQSCIGQQDDEEEEQITDNIQDMVIEGNDELGYTLDIAGNNELVNSGMGENKMQEQKNIQQVSKIQQ